MLSSHSMRLPSDVPVGETTRLLSETTVLTDKVPQLSPTKSAAFYVLLLFFPLAIFATLRGLGTNLGLSRRSAMVVNHPNEEELLSPIPDGTILCQGFSSLLDDSNKQTDAYSLQWYCEPDSWPSNSASREGQGGSWEVLPAEDDKDKAASSSLRLVPPSKKDFWRKTFYNPLLIKDDAPVAYVTLDAQRKQWYTVSVSFTLTAVRQFDQAGLLVRINADHWLKTGIEVVDEEPRLSAVVTNVYSDWSTQSWPDYSRSTGDGGPNRTIVHCQLRIHCRGESFVVEAKRAAGDWEFVRIAHLSAGVVYPSDPISSIAVGAAPEPGNLWAGVFAASPEDQQGSSAIFSNFRVVAGSSFDHNADGNT